MPGRGPNAKAGGRRRRNEPERGEWRAAKGVGWQYGRKPNPPAGLMPQSLEAWRTWMGSWFAAHWTPDDLPGLRILVLLYDQVIRGEFQRSAELRLGMDTYGITPKGRQDRRWMAPVEDVAPVPEQQTEAPNPYAHLRAVK